MPKRPSMKELFADEIEAMLEEMPFASVRVVDLCDRCGVTSQAFYYHFRDKYDLVSWMFLCDTAAAHADTDLGYTPERLADGFRQLEKRKNFYRKTYEDDSLNSIGNYIQRFNAKSAVAALRHLNGDDDVSAQQLAAIKYHSYGMVGLCREWYSGDSDMTVEELARFQYDSTPPFLREAYDAYPITSDHLFQRDQYEA